MSKLGSFLRTVLISGLFALIFRTFLFQPFSIPSGSMKPTLLVGDYLFVSKFAYGWSRHSFPFSFFPMDDRLMGKQPERGDVIVFKLPKDNRTDYIKRVVGLPGDRVKLIRGHLFINGEMAKVLSAGRFREEGLPLEAASNLSGCFKDELSPGLVCVSDLFQERFPGSDKIHFIINSDDNDARHDNTKEFVVPEGYYFFLGDNRDNSLDSRYIDRVGFVPYENLVGKALFVFLSSDNNWALAFWRWRLDRFFKAII